jgi:cell division septation protein DedD
MERRRYERIAVNLNVALLDERAMPRGCRVRDVSQGGMLLQFEHPGGASYAAGNAVQVRISVKEHDERRVLLLPATITRVEENGMGVVFTRPQAELMQLLEPYQLDREQAAAPALAVVHSRAAGGGEQRPATDDPPQPRHRHHATSARAGARMAARIAAARAAIRTGGGEAAQDGAAAGDRRLFQVGLASLAVAGAIAVFDLASSSSVNHRLGALESTVEQQAEAVAGVQIRLTADKARESVIDDLKAQVQELTVSVAALETGHIQATPSQENADAGSPPGPPPVASKSAPGAPADSGAKATPPRVDKPAKKGPWVINLVSLYDQAAADQFAQRAKSLGIPVEQNRTLVKDKPVWRVQVSGFDSHDQASAYGNANKTKLGLKNVWIFKR